MARVSPCGDQSKYGPAAKGKHPAQPNNYDVPYLAQALQQAVTDSDSVLMQYSQPTPISSNG